MQYLKRKAAYNIGLALCRLTETQFSTIEQLASVVPSLTDIAEQQNLTSTN